MVMKTIIISIYKVKMNYQSKILYIKKTMNLKNMNKKMIIMIVIIFKILKKNCN
jgi:hypothetical protein